MLFSRKYKLNIAEPCHEKWEEMHPSAQGRFCDSCSKNVVDFTGMTEKEIATYFRNKPANMCGRFRNEQLEKTYHPQIQVRLPFHQRILRFVISLFITNAIADKAVAQTDTIPVKTVDSLPRLVINDSILKDSLAFAKADTAVVNFDSLPHVSITVDTALFIDAPIYTIEFVTTTLGMVAYDPPPDPGTSFVDLCRVKMINTIFRRGETNVEDDRSPDKKKKPLEIPHEELAAVLPDEIRRKKG